MGKLLIALLLLAGCQSTELIGTWSGKFSGSIMALKLKADGTGLFCYSRNATFRVKSVKWDNSEITTAKGMVIVIDDVDDNALNLSVNGKSEVFYRNGKSSWYCRRKLKG